MKPSSVATVAAMGTAAIMAAPAITAIGPVRRSLTPRLAGIGTNHHIALTFDDGPDPTSTPRFLDLLDQYDVRVTFFVLAAQAKAVPSLIRRMVDERHEVAIHGWSHHCTLAIPTTCLTRGS